MRLRAVTLSIALLCGSLASQAQDGWQQKVRDELPLLGHRNWIVIVDSAYPLQTSPGIETIETDADHLAVLHYVLHEVKESRHVRPLVHTDKELDYLPEAEAPGVSQYRADLKQEIASFPADSILHQELIVQLAETGRSMHVLVLKTRMAIPYTSVFLQLDCQYWSADSEAKLRAAMKAAPSQHEAAR